MKKIVTIMLVIILTLSMTACGKKVDTKESNAPSGQSNEQTKDSGTEGEELEHVTIKLTYPGSPQKDEVMVEEAINEYLKDKINASIDLDPIEWSAYLEKTNLMMATGDELDMLFTASWYEYYTNVSKKAFVPLNDLIDTYAPKTKELLHPALFEGPKVNNELYALPTNKEIASARGLFFRKDLVDKYNFDISKIKSMDDFEPILEPMLEVIKENEPGIYPYYCNGMGLPQFNNLNDAVGSTLGVYNPRTGKIEYGEEQPEHMAMLKLAYKWNNKGYINEDAITAQESVPNMFATYMNYKPGKDAEMSTQLGVELIGIPIGKIKTTTEDVTGSMIAISRTSKNPERCMMFLELLNTDKFLNNLLNFGIEDVHYVKVKENVIDFPEGVTAQTSRYYPSSQWMFQNQFLNYLRVQEAEDKWEQFKAFNEAAEQSPLLGFSFDSSSVKSEIAACKNVGDEFSTSLAVGVMEPEEGVKKYLEKVKANGSEKIIAEKQRQVDEFLANKK
ncbi:ABC transporter substrate-binding protein [Vallitalea maricola]|uniref:ABC transporter substrate-binding protein n=1 Tax=Vallitalea maricola TaxID=3074433 RepID=A0ACB5UPV8_9FIRM|nr:ABC transporter substrate-binding protein [Vallitalea sp. AN17-2]